MTLCPLKGCFKSFYQKDSTREQELKYSDNIIFKKLGRRLVEIEKIGGSLFTVIFNIQI